MAERLIAVCSWCLCASCWHGEHMCERSGTGGVVNVSVDELRKLDREHADNWSAAKMAAVYGEGSNAHLRALAVDRAEAVPKPAPVADPVPLTALDRADIRRELEAREESLELDARLFRLTKRSFHAIELSARAARVRQLIALLAVLVLCACNEWPLGAPPYTVCLDGSVPADDREVWREAEARWNVEIGMAVLLDDTRDCDVRVRASSELDEPACTLPVDDHVRIFYVPVLLEPCHALHELAHVLLGPGVHIPGTVLDEYGCDHPDVLAPVAARVRDKWGL